MTGPPALFEVRGVSKHYRPGTAREVRAVHEVSLAVRRGGFAALTGPSGSGKTTLLALLGALERPTGGRVLFDGRDLGRCSDMELARTRRRLGFVFQDAALIPGLSAADNVGYPLIPRGVPARARAAKAAELLARLGLADRADARPGELSGGQQQRVALARALAGGPDALLADEPTSNLDPGTAGVVAAVLREFHAGGGTVVLATHDPDLVGLATDVFDLNTHLGGDRPGRAEPA